MHLKTKTGLALIVLGIGILAAWSWWTRSRNFVPVSMPIAPAAGRSITSAFTLNFDGLYLVEIEAEKTIPLDALHCLMGVEKDPEECKSMPSVIAATWALSSEARDIGHGSSQEQFGRPVRTNGVTRVIGEFQGKAGRSYKLEVTFAAEPAGLEAAHPRLKVAVASIAYTDIESAKMLVFSTVFICVLFGVMLLAAALLSKTKQTDPSLGSR
jgi:hypothetical protein